MDQELLVETARGTLEVGESGQSFGPDPIIIAGAIREIVEVRVEVALQHRAILTRLPPFDARFVPVARLDADEDAEHDDDEVDRHGEPVVVDDMFADPTKNHASSHRRSSPQPNRHGIVTTA